MYTKRWLVLLWLACLVLHVSAKSRPRKPKVPITHNPIPASATKSNESPIHSLHGNYKPTIHLHHHAVHRRQEWDHDTAGCHFQTHGKWELLPKQFYLYQDDTAHLGTLQQAYNIWRDAAPQIPEPTFLVTSELPSSKGDLKQKKRRMRNGRNEIAFTEVSTEEARDGHRILAETYVWKDVADNTIVEVDIIFHKHSGIKWNVEGEYDLLSVAVCEFGFGLGLDHSNSENHSAKRSLECGDLQGIQQLYRAIDSSRSM
jgi:hypothetical protein